MAEDDSYHTLIERLFDSLDLSADQPPTSPLQWQQFLGKVDELCRNEGGETLILDERLDQLIANAVDAFILHDTAGHILEINQATCEMLGYSRGELIGSHVSKFEMDLEPGAFWGDMTTNEVFTVEGTHRRKDGETYPVESRVGAFQLNGQKVILALCRDITERKERERRLERLNDALQQARDEALEADRAKSEFLANMSHELRTPLTSIIGYSEMILEEMDAGQEVRREDISRIGDAGEHMLSLLNTVLNLSKVEAGHVDVEAESFAVGTMLEELRATVEPLAAENDNEFAIEVDGIDEMRTDKVKLRQILLNLLSNDCKFTEEGRVCLSARTTPNGETAIFDVRDNGVGMTDAQLKRVFEAFRQADNQDTSTKAGTGLGLPLTRQYSQLLGGDITADSEPGEGSTFTVRIPVEMVWED